MMGGGASFGYVNHSMASTSRRPKTKFDGQRKKQLTVDIYIRRIKEFYSLFGRPGGEHCFCKTFSTLYKGMMIHEAMDLDLLHQSLIWTRVIMVGWNSFLTSYTSPGKTAMMTSQ